MRILMICDEYPPCQHGGIGTVTRILAESYVKHGHEVWVMGFYPYFRKAKAKEKKKGVKIHRIHYGNYLLLKLSRHPILGRFINIRRPFYSYTRKLKKLVEKKNIEVIEMADYHEAFVMSGPKFISFPDFDVPLIVKLHGSSTFFRNLREYPTENKHVFRKEKQLLSRADHIIGVSQFVRDLTFKLFDIDMPSSIIYNSLPVKAELNYRPDPDTPRVVFAGKITHKKGIFSLLKAWNLLAAEFPGARLEIYGSGTDEAFQKARDLLAPAIRETVRFNGFIQSKKLYDIYSTASCAVFPSYAEAFGMTPLEAMITGCPTIFTRRTSGNEIIEHGVDGMLVDPDDPQDIARQIRFMLSRRVEAESMGLKGAHKVREKFDSSSICMQHIRLYEQLKSNV